MLANFNRYLKKIIVFVIIFVGSLIIGTYVYGVLIGFKSSGIVQNIDDITVRDKTNPEVLSGLKIPAPITYYTYNSAYFGGNSHILVLQFKIDEEGFVEIFTKGSEYNKDGDDYLVYNGAKIYKIMPDKFENLDYASNRLAIAESVMPNKLYKELLETVDNGDLLAESSSHCGFWDRNTASATIIISNYRR
jgi:hypothetical protein